MHLDQCGKKNNKRTSTKVKIDMYSKNVESGHKDPELCEHKNTQWQIVTEPNSRAFKEKVCLDCGKLLAENLLQKRAEIQYSQQKYSKISPITTTKSGRKLDVKNM